MPSLVQDADRIGEVGEELALAQLPGERVEHGEARRVLELRVDLLGGAAGVLRVEQHRGRRTSRCTGGRGPPGCGSRSTCRPSGVLTTARSERPSVEELRLPDEDRAGPPRAGRAARSPASGGWSIGVNRVLGQMLRCTSSGLTACSTKNTSPATANELAQRPRAGVAAGLQVGDGELLAVAERAAHEQHDDRGDPRQRALARSTSAASGAAGAGRSRPGRARSPGRSARSGAPPGASGGRSGPRGSSPSPSPSPPPPVGRSGPRGPRGPPGVPGRRVPDPNSMRHPPRRSAGPLIGRKPTRRGAGAGVSPRRG